MATNKPRQHRSQALPLAILAAVVLVIGLFGFAWAQEISPAAVQVGHVGTEYTYSDNLHGLEGNFVNNTEDVKDITVTYSLVGLDQEGNDKVWASEVKGYQVQPHDVHFLKFFPQVSLPAVSDQYHYWYMVQTCEDGTTYCEVSGRGLFDDRLGNGEYGTLNAVIEIQPDPANVCLVQARYKVHNDPKTALYDDVSNGLIHEEELTEVDADGWTPWSQVIPLTAGTYRLVATSPDPNIAGIEEKFKVSTPECPPETSTPTVTPPGTTETATPVTVTATPTITPTIPQTATPTKVPQGCDALLLTNQTMVAPYKVTVKLSGHGVAMENGTITISDGRVIPVHNDVELTIEFPGVGTYSLVGILFDGDKVFGGSQCNGTVEFTEEKTLTPTPQAPAKVFLPGIRNDATPTPTVPPTPTPTPNLEGCVVGLDPIIKGPYTLNPAVKTGWMDLDWNSNQGHVGSDEAVSSWLPGLVDPTGKVRYEIMLAARGKQTLVIGMKKDGVVLAPTNDFTDEADNQVHSRLRPFKNGSDNGSAQFNSWEVQYYYGPGWTGRLVSWCESIQAGADMKPASVTSVDLKAEGYTEVMPAVQDSAAAAAMMSGQ